MSTSRWDPFREMLSLRDAMNQLLEQSYIRPGAAGGGEAQGAAQSLALDVAERGDAYEVTASLPGARPEDIQVTVVGDTLTIRAATRADEERQQGNYLLRERRGGVMQRTLTLPAPIESDAVEADYEHGVLRLRLPKSRATLPRRIEVRSGAAGAGQARGGLTDHASARHPSLEQQTPGLDRAQEEQTRRDAEAYFGQQGGQGQGQPGGQAGQAGTRSGQG